MSTLAVLAVALATQTATLGTTTATITWNDEPFARDLRVKIERAGQTVVDEALDKSLGPAGDEAVRVRDLDGDSRPEVIVDGYSGGAHCCTTTYVWNGGDNAKSEHAWGNTGYRLRDVDGNGTLEFDGSDDFSYAFGSYAESRQPIKILDARLQNVTKSFPAAVTRDLRRQRSAYVRLRGRANARPALAAYVADLHSLGRHRDADATLQTALRRGWLRKKQYFDVPPFGRAYIRRLNEMLEKGGYLSPKSERTVSTI
jgi:hypothetical protein